jgi:prophage antirepressor-like protein
LQVVITPEISTFKFHNIELRTVLIDGEPWFVAADAVKAVGITNMGNAYARLSGTEQSNIRRVDVGMKPGRDMKIVNESGLYKLVMRSDKAQAKEFQEWVTGTERAPFER